MGEKCGTFGREERYVQGFGGERTGQDLIFLNLVFIGLCIVIYYYITTNKINLLSQIIYSCKTLYMFRTVFPSIIRSLKLRIQQRYMSNSCCYWG